MLETVIFVAFFCAFPRIIYRNLETFVALFHKISSDFSALLDRCFAILRVKFGAFCLFGAFLVCFRCVFWCACVPVRSGAFFKYLKNAPNLRDWSVRHFLNFLVRFVGPSFVADSTYRANFRYSPKSSRRYEHFRPLFAFSGPPGLVLRLR